MGEQGKILEMRALVFWLLIQHYLQADQELSIEAFWLGEERFRTEMTSNYKDGMPPRKVSKLGTEASRFVNEGDVLWDLKEHYQQWDLALEQGWIIYNQTTGYLVAKAPIQELGLLELRHEVSMEPKNVRLGVDVFEVKEATFGWVDWQKKWDEVEKELLFTTKGTGRSGQVVIQRFEGEEDLKCKLEFQPTLGADGFFHDVRLAWSFESDSTEYHLNTGLALADQSPYFVELGSVDEVGVRVARFLPETLIVGGPPMRDWHLYENEEDSTDLSFEQCFGGTALRDDGERFCHFWEVGSWFLNDLLDPVDDDPFATSEREESSLLEVVDQEDVPSILKKYFPREQWTDVQKVFVDSGLDLEAGDFTYFGKLRGILVVGAQDKGTIDIADQIVSPLHCGAPKNFHCCFTLIQEKGGKKRMLAKSILSGRSGETAEVNWKWDSGSWKLEAQPTLGVDYTLYDVRLFSGFEGEEKFELNSGVTYRHGQVQEFLLKETADGRYSMRLEMVLVNAHGEELGD